MTFFTVRESQAKKMNLFPSKVPTHGQRADCHEYNRKRGFDWLAFRNISHFSISNAEYALQKYSVMPLNFVQLKDDISRKS